MGLYMGYQRNYIVLYRTGELLPVSSTIHRNAFQCMAEDTEHAEEQCEDAYPGCDVVWVVETDNVETAYADYWNTTVGFGEAGLHQHGGINDHLENH